MKINGASAVLLLSSILAAVSCASDANKKLAATANSEVMQTTDKTMAEGSAPETAAPSSEVSPDSQDSRDEDASSSKHQDDSGAEDAESLRDEKYTQQNTSESKGNIPNQADNQAEEQTPEDEENQGVRDDQDTPSNQPETADQGIQPETALAMDQELQESQGDADIPNEADDQAEEQTPGDEEKQGVRENQDTPSNQTETADQGTQPETALALAQKLQESQGDADIPNQADNQAEEQTPEDEEKQGVRDDQDTPSNQPETADQGIQPETALAMDQELQESQGDADIPNEADNQAEEPPSGDEEKQEVRENQDAPSNQTETADQGIQPETALALAQNLQESQGDADIPNEADNQAEEQTPEDEEKQGVRDDQDTPSNQTETADQGIQPETALALAQNLKESQGDADIPNEADNQAEEQTPGDEEKQGVLENQDTPNNQAEVADQGMPPDGFQDQKENHIEPRDREDLDSFSIGKNPSNKQEDKEKLSLLTDSLIPEEKSKSEFLDEGGEGGGTGSPQRPQTLDDAGASSGKQPLLNEADKNDGLNVVKIPEEAIYESDNASPKTELELDSEGGETLSDFSADLQGKGWVFRSDLSTSGDWRFINRDQVGETTRFNFQFSNPGIWNLVFDRRSLASGGVERVVKRVDKGVVKDVSSESLQEVSENSILEDDKKQRQKVEAEQQTEAGDLTHEAMIREALQTDSISLLLKWLPPYLADNPDLEVLESVLDVLDNTAEYDDEEMAVLEELSQFQTHEKSAEWNYRLAAKLEQPGERRDILRAMEFYQMVVDSWPYSEWRELAEKRLIWLNRHFFRLQ